MKQNILNITIYIIFIFGIYGAGSLVLTEFLHNDSCPKIGIIPACYIIFLCLIVPFIAQILNKGKVIYFAFITIALTIATYGSVGQLLGLVQCPKTVSGVPMCYISFILFFELLFLKILANSKIIERLS